MKHIYPIFDDIVGRKSKEHRLKQNSIVVWLIGLSGSGKSTIAKNVEKQLFQQGYLTQLLDGDNLRSGLNGDLGFTQNDRVENLRRTAEVAKLFKDAGFVTIVSFITPTEASRKRAKDIIGVQDFVEVFVKCPIEVCEQRDVKGLYKKARAGEIEDFTGISAPFEAPQHADLVLESDQRTLVDCVAALEAVILQRISRGETPEK